MHGTHVRLDLRFSLSSIIFSLATVTGVELPRPSLVFCLFFQIMRILVGIILFPIASIVLTFGNVLPFLLRNNIDIYGRRVGATNLFPSSAAPRNLLVVMVLLVGLALIDRLPIRHVNRERIRGFTPSEVFLLLFSGLVLLGTP